MERPIVSTGAELAKCVHDDVRYVRNHNFQNILSVGPYERESWRKIPKNVHSCAIPGEDIHAWFHTVGKVPGSTPMFGQLKILRERIAKLLEWYAYDPPPESDDCRMTLDKDLGTLRSLQTFLETTFHRVETSKKAEFQPTFMNIDFEKHVYAGGNSVIPRLEERTFNDRKCFSINEYHDLLTQRTIARIGFSNHQAVVHYIGIVRDRLNQTIIELVDIGIEPGFERLGGKEAIAADLLPYVTLCGPKRYADSIDYAVDRHH